MGNCLACFATNKDRSSSRADGSQCKYQKSAEGSIGGDGGTAIVAMGLKSQDVLHANHNNNYPMTASYPHQQRHNRDVLDKSETEGLLGPLQSNCDDTRGTATITAQGSAMSTSSSSSTATNYGLKLKNILNGNLGLTSSSSTVTTIPSASQQKGIAASGAAVKGQLLGQISDNKINALFESYKDEECEDAILPQGIERLCCDLRYKPEDFPVLVLAWRLDASQMCRFTKTEFIQGLHTLNADSIESIRQRLEEEVVRLGSDAELFKNLYRFTFKFGLESDLRTLPLDMAISLWRLVFTVHTPEILGKWLDYLGANPQIRGIPKDTWNMFLNFAATCDIYSYSDEDAWPSVFDDFVEYENERRRVQEEEKKEELDGSS